MKVRKGDIVQVTFLDHAEGNDHFEFTTYGRILSQNKDAIVICSWQYSDTKEPVDPHDANVILHTILKVAITRITKLVAIDCN
jgi:hypothetical protein